MYHFIMTENNWISRWSNDQIRSILIEQSVFFWQQDTGIQRFRLQQIIQAADVPHAVVISGLRRVGKSTLLAQLAHHLGRDLFYYVNFEDERFLGFESQNANALYQILVELYGERKIFLLDEIQNVPGWEHFVRRFMDQGFKFYITGSNASLLSRELGTHLTGRYLSVELFPFSLVEVLQFHQQPIPDLDRMTTVENARLNAALTTYMQTGGIPLALKYPELPLLRTLFDDVLYRDIAARYHLGEIQALKAIAQFLVSNPSGTVSFNKLKEQFRLGSVNTVSNYIGYLEDSWLFFTCRLFDYSIKRQQIAPKKMYAIDTGLVNAVGFHFSPNTGKLLENAVFLALRRQTSEVYYYLTPSGYEVDFYLPEQGQLIQVVENMQQPETRQRELRALEDAAKKLELRSILIITSESEDGLMIGETPVQVQSAAVWLLTNPG
jgi:uncharacterized protein